MPPCAICFLCKFYCPQGQQQAVISDLTTELEDSRQFSLNSLATLLAVIMVSGSKTLQPVVLTILIYTISLRLSINTCFLQNFPTVSRFLHAMPLLGTLSMASIELISRLQSPAVATAGILLGVLPLATLVVRHGRQCTETPLTARLQMQDASAPATST